MDGPPTKRRFEYGLGPRGSAVEQRWGATGGPWIVHGVGLHRAGVPGNCSETQEKAFESIPVRDGQRSSFREVNAKSSVYNARCSEAHSSRTSGAASANRTLRT